MSPYGKLKEIMNSPYEALFRKYKGECQIFFETGTHTGDSIILAHELGFKKIISVEIDSGIQNQALTRIAALSEEEQKKFHLFLGDSKDKLPEMLALVDTPAMFWIDAHNMNGAPAFIELELIKGHSIKNHTILVDDIPLYFGDGNNLIAAIKQINQYYKFVFETNWCGRENYHLAAYI